MGRSAITARGENAIVEYWSRRLGPAAEALARLQRIATGTSFPATDDARDCRYCDFAAVCRVRVDNFGGVDSPQAAWSKETGLQLPEAEALRILRHVDG